MGMHINSYQEFCSYLHVSRETYEKLEIFYNTLIKWQSTINLISRSSIENLWVRHILDSAQLYRFTSDINGKIFDFGSGAGFPGLILAIMGNQNINIVESDQKKCTFMREILTLSETSVTIHNCRIEDLDFVGVELITSRALASLNKLIDYVDLFMKKAQKKSESFPKLLFLKGKRYKSELLELSKISHFKYDLYPSLTDEFGKIIYINELTMKQTNE